MVEKVTLKNQDRITIPWLDKTVLVYTTLKGDLGVELCWMVVLKHLDRFPNGELMVMFVPCVFFIYQYDTMIFVGTYPYDTDIDFLSLDIVCF